MSQRPADPSHTPPPVAAASRWPLVAVVLLVAVSITAHLWGIKRNLPVWLEMDEIVLYAPAVRIASTGDFNPNWFGYPGSTVIYPMAALLHAWQALSLGGSWFTASPLASSGLEPDGWQLIMIGRLLSAAYSVLTLPLIFSLSRRCLGGHGAAVATLLATFSPVTVDFAQQLRTDSGGMFFGVLFLVLCVRLLEQPSWQRQAAAGLALGLAIATRFLLAAVAPVLLATEAFLLRRLWHAGSDPAGLHQPQRRLAPEQRAPEPRANQRQARDLLVGASIAGACVFIGFAASTPYFVIDFSNAWATFRFAAEKQGTHLGADGLGFVGNLWWYTSSAIPDSLGAFQTSLAAVGLGLAIASREPLRALIGLYIVGFIGGICMLGVHWQRWLLPVLPVLSLLAADALSFLGRAATGWIRPATSSLPSSAAADRASAALVAAAGLLLVISPARELARAAVIRSTPSTVISARNWLIENLPPGVTIARERHTAPIDGANFRILTRAALANESVETYQLLGADYLLTSSYIITRFQQEPARYSRELAFYRQLPFRAKLVHEIKRAPMQDGPVVRIYALSERAKAAVRKP